MTIQHAAFRAGTPCWVDLFSSDVAKSKYFYTNLFGWTATEDAAEFGGYANFLSDGHLVAGVMGGNTSHSPQGDSWNTYLSSVDIGATLAASVKHGATIVVPAKVIGELGSMAVMIDPVGAEIGVWQAGTHTGFGKFNEGSSVVWDEMHTRDINRSTDFYSSVFGWSIGKLHDTDELRYYTGQVDGISVAGIMDTAGFLPADVPSHWSVYFSVANADQTVRAATDLGASIVQPAQDTPFGRIAELTDSTGAMFKLHQLLANS